MATRDVVIKASRLLLLLMVVVAAACQVPRPLEPATSLTAAGIQAGPSAAAGRGRLLIQIRWPDRDVRGFKAALIPLSTNAIAIDVETAEGTSLAQQVVARASGQSVATASIELDTASNLKVKARAYRSANPDLANDAPIAQGNAAGVTVAPSVDTAVAITLNALFAPTLSSLSAYGGKVGDVVTISGTNLGTIDGVDPIVRLNGTGASVSAQVTPVNDTTLQFTVPSNAAVGRVVVENDGVSSTSNVIYWVADQLAIAATKADWDSSGATTRIFLPGSSNTFTVTPNWVLSAGANAGSYGAPPSVSWVLGDPAAGAFNAFDAFIAGSDVRDTSVKARLGTLESSALTASVQNVSVAIALGATTLGAGEGLAIGYTLTNTFSNLAPNDLATLTTASPSILDVTATTLSKAAGAGNSYGTVPLTATLKNDGRRSASAEITLYNYRSTTLNALNFETYGGQRTAVAGQVEGMTLDPSGNAYIADSQNHVIRKITTGGAVSVWAGTGSEGMDNGDQTLSATFRSPVDVATGSDGIIYVADSGNNAIRKIANTNVTTLISDLSNPPRAIVVSADETVYVAAGHCILIKQSGQSEAVFAGNCSESGATDETGSAARFNTPVGLALDAQGRLLVAETGRIRRITSGAVVTTVAGDGSCSDTAYEGTASGTKVCPGDIAADGAGNIYVLSTSWLQVINAAGVLTRLAGSGNQGGAGAYQDGVGTDARFFGARSVALDSSRLYVADKDALRKLARVP